jgi:hypothetical protein
MNICSFQRCNIGLYERTVLQTDKTLLLHIAADDVEDEPILDMNSRFRFPSNKINLIFFLENTEISDPQRGT